MLRQEQDVSSNRPNPSFSNQPLIANWLARMQARPSYAKEVEAKLGPALTGKMRAGAHPYWEKVRLASGRARV